MNLEKGAKASDLFIDKVERARGDLTNKDEQIESIKPKNVDEFKCMAARIDEDLSDVSEKQAKETECRFD